MNKNTSEIVTEILATVKKKGATEAEVVYSKGKGLSISLRNGDVDTIENSEDSSLILTVYNGKAKGSASSALLDEASIALTIEKAWEIAKLTQEDEFAGLADEELLANPADFKDLDIYHPTDVTPDAMIENGLKAEKAALETKGIIVDETNISIGEGFSVYASSHGFLGTKQGTNCSMSVVAIAEKDGAMERDYWWDAVRDYNNMMPATELGKKAAARTIARVGARKVKSCKVPVLFDATVAQGLVGHMLSALAGSSLYQDASFLKDDLNTQIFPEWFEIHENPFIKGGFASRNFDSNGVATKARNIIDSGVLTGFLLSIYSARRLGLVTTGNAGGAHNLFIKTHNNSEKSFDDALKQLNTGLYVTSVMGQGVNTINGDYSRGASGFWIENGEIQFPVSEITIASNLKDMYKNLVLIANDTDQRTKIQTGSWLIEEMTIAGV
ncbi:MAG TPA: metalloprotease PmbA [Oceanospirillales bacterium]|nr:metalloprotease PmbA [Oceanospirillales bacterium]